MPAASEQRRGNHQIYGQGSESVLVAHEADSIDSVTDSATETAPSHLRIVGQVDGLAHDLLGDGRDVLGHARVAHQRRKRLQTALLPPRQHRPQGQAEQG